MEIGNYCRQGFIGVRYLFQQGHLYGEVFNTAEAFIGVRYLLQTGIYWREVIADRHLLE